MLDKVERTVPPGGQQHDLQKWLKLPTMPPQEMPPRPEVNCKMMMIQDTSDDALSQVAACSCTLVTDAPLQRAVLPPRPRLSVQVHSRSRGLLSLCIRDFWALCMSYGFRTAPPGASWFILPLCTLPCSFPRIGTLRQYCFCTLYSGMSHIHVPLRSRTGAPPSPLPSHGGGNQRCRQPPGGSEGTGQVKVNLRVLRTPYSLLGRGCVSDQTL